MSLRQVYSHLDKRIIFRETFNSEQSVKRNSGIPTDVIFSNGIADFNGSTSNVYFTNGIQYHISNLKDFSIRLKLKANDLTTQQTILNSGIVSLNRVGIAIGSGTFAAGVLKPNAQWEFNSCSITDTDEHEYILTWDSNTQTFYLYKDSIVQIGTTNVIGTLGNNAFYLGSRNGGYDYFFNGNINLIEIYKDILTAEEVNLSYTKNLYKKPIFNQKKFIFNTELNTTSNAISINNEADSTTLWGEVLLNGTGANIFESQAIETNNSSYTFHAECNDTPSGLARIYYWLNNYCTNGKRYKLSIDARHVGTGGDWIITISSNSASTGTLIPIVILTNSDTTWQTYTVEWTHNSTNTDYLVISEYSIPNDGGVYVDNLSIKEVRPELNEILSINPLKGVIEDKYGNSITNTGVDIVRDKGYKMKFDGSTSKLDLSSPASLNIPIISISVWVKPFTNIDGQVIISKYNDQINRGWAIAQDSLNNFRCDFSILGTQVTIQNKGINNKQWTLLTSTFDGFNALFYQNGIELGSDIGLITLDTSSTDFTIGSPSTWGGTSKFYGLIGEIKIISGVLTQEQIMNYYQATKNDYIG